MIGRAVRATVSNKLRTLATAGVVAVAHGLAPAQRMPRLPQFGRVAAHANFYFRLHIVLLCFNFRDGFAVMAYINSTGEPPRLTRPEDSRASATANPETPAPLNSRQGLPVRLQ